MDESTKHTYNRQTAGQVVTSKLQGQHDASSAALNLLLKLYARCQQNLGVNVPSFNFLPHSVLLLYAFPVCGHVQPSTEVLNRFWITDLEAIDITESPHSILADHFNTAC